VGSGVVSRWPVLVSLPVSVNVVEVFPNSFTMAARLRPDDRDGIAATASCTLSPGGEVPKAIRDEFIALAHEAKHIH
jgi:hypothetical protein